MNKKHYIAHDQMDKGYCNHNVYHDGERISLKSLHSYSIEFRVSPLKQYRCNLLSNKEVQLNTTVPHAINSPNNTSELHQKSMHKSQRQWLIFTQKYIYKFVEFTK